MNKVFLNSFFFCFFFVLISPVLLAQATEKSLLEAWETKQKNDPKTVLFEKLEENRYRFKTKRFAFDGELKIFSVIVDKWERRTKKLACPEFRPQARISLPQLDFFGYL